jgi:hypothetical protein
MADRPGESNHHAAEIERDTLEVRVEGVTSKFLPGDEPVFGRGAQIDIDDNPYLHRQLGRFIHQQGWWWLQNIGSSTLLQVVELRSGAASRVPPGTQAVLTSPHQVVRFEAGRSKYELEADQTPRLPSSLDWAQTDSGADTIDITDLPINDEQRLLLLTMCESRLRDPLGPLDLPSNQEIADRLGWSITKLNRKLDWLCERMARQGVPGMKEADGRATRRRERLVEHAVNARLVRLDDLVEFDRQG